MTIQLISCATLKNDIPPFPSEETENGETCLRYFDAAELTIIIDKETTEIEFIETPGVAVPLWYWRKLIGWIVDVKGVK